MSAGYSFRGRPMDWHPDRQAIEQERQRWVYEKIDGMSWAITELAVDPDREYTIHRDAYIETGDPRQLVWALQYVRA